MTNINVYTKLVYLIPIEYENKWFGIMYLVYILNLEDSDSKVGLLHNFW
jgi:hypothetical protein